MWKLSSGMLPGAPKHGELSTTSLLPASALIWHAPLEASAAAMPRLLELPEPPDAVLCSNKLLAIDALRALYERGIRVPDDVAVAGFDDIERAIHDTVPDND